MQISITPPASQTSFLLLRIALLLAPAVGLYTTVGSIDHGWLCRAWGDSDIREKRMRPYISALYGPAGPGTLAELNRLCASSSGQSDISAYTALAAWVKSKAPKLPSDHWDWSEIYEQDADKVETLLPSVSSEFVRVLDHGCGRGEMLDVLVRRLDLSPEQAHCIEVADYMPAETKKKITLHILGDPVEDIKALAGGELKATFDVVSSWGVFHHIGDTEARVAALQSIGKMAKPNGFFLLSDWDSTGPDLVGAWYDVAHWLLYILAAQVAPKDAGALDIGTRYESFGSLKKTLITDNGFVYERLLSSPNKSPIGSYEAAFRKYSMQPFGGIWPSFNGSLPREGPSNREDEAQGHRHAGARKRTNVAQLSKVPGQLNDVPNLPEPIWPIPFRRLLSVSK